MSLWIVSDLDRVALITCCDAHQWSISVPTVTVPIYIDGNVFAEVVAGGCGDIYWAANLLASWLDDLLRLENEIESLSSEVVHSYSELHLLYDLGTRLGGVVEPEVASELVIKELVVHIGAAEAELLLGTHQEQRRVAHVVNQGRSGTVSAPLARASSSLVVNGEIMGTIVVRGKLNGAEFRSEDLKLLAGVAAVTAPAIRNAQLYQQARLRAETDAVTGLWNHRRLQERLDEELERSRRHGHVLSIIVVEIDQLQLFHDVYGHVIGNEVLSLAARCLRTTVRQTDVIGSYGDDKFIVVLPETDNAGVRELAHRILAAIRTSEVVVDGSRLSAGFSMGSVTFPDDALTKHELIARANTALEEAKSNGGSTIRCFGQSEPDVFQAASGEIFSIFSGLVRAVDSKDHYTLEHSNVVTDAAVQLARRLDLPSDLCEALRIAGPLHDIGKIGIPDRVLKKPGRLTSEESEIMKQHVILSEIILRGAQDDNMLAAVAHHHERFDGDGYPFGKRGEEIPLVGRIMAIADAYSAMCMDRPYRKGLLWPDIRQQLEAGCGTQFDPDLVPIFIEVMEQQNTLPPDPQSFATAGSLLRAGVTT
ncbi:MAG: hypothetical protein NVS4B8_00700 [Herpetosiphon sp.]